MHVLNMQAQYMHEKERNIKQVDTVIKVIKNLLTFESSLFIPNLFNFKGEMYDY